MLGGAPRAPPVESGGRVKGEASLPKAGAEGTLDAPEHSATIKIPPSQQAHPQVTPSPKDEGADFRRRGYKPRDSEGEHGLSLML